MTDLQSGFVMYCVGVVSGISVAMIVRPYDFNNDPDKELKCEKSTPFWARLSAWVRSLR